MVAKTRLAEGKGFCFYREDFNDEQVCLELYGGVEFEASQKRVTVKIPIAVWEFVRQIAAMEFDLTDKTDEELRQIAEQEIDQRIARQKLLKEKISKPDKKGGINYFARLSSFKYTVLGEPREQQIEREVESNLNRRAAQQDALKKMKEFQLVKADLP